MYFTFDTVGSRVQIGTRTFTVVACLPSEKRQLQAETGEYTIFTRTELTNLYFDRKLFFVMNDCIMQYGTKDQLVAPADLSRLSETKLAAIDRKMVYIKALYSPELNRFCMDAHAQRRLGDVAFRLEDRNPPHPVTVWRWVQRWKKSYGDPTALKPRKKKALSVDINKTDDIVTISGSARFDPEAVLITAQYIRSFYLTQQRHSIDETANEIERHIESLNARRQDGKILVPPSVRTLARWISKLDKYQVCRLRYGEETARRNFPNLAAAPQPQEILERVELDHTPLDLMVVDMDKRLILGRPWLVALIDAYSRMVLGFHLSFGPPSIDSVFACIKHAVSPKQYISERYPDIKNAWPCQGLFQTIHVDNAMENHSHAIQSSMLTLSAVLEFSPAGAPNFKGKVENFLGKVNRKLIHRMPGTVFSNPSERGEYDYEETAIIDLNDLDWAIHKWIVDVYHQTPHAGIRTTPQERWAQSAETHVMRLPAIPQQLDVILGVPRERTLRRCGVELFHLYYNCDRLHAMARKHGHGFHVQLKFNTKDIGAIYVFDPDENEYFRVPAIDADYANGLPLRVHLMVMKTFRQQKEGKGVNRPSHLALLEARSSIWSKLERMRGSKKLKSRKKAAREFGYGSDQQKGSAGKASVEPPISDHEPIPNPEGVYNSSFPTISLR